MGSHIADNIMQEYKKKKRYEQNKAWSKMQNFIKENCANCENKDTSLCNVTLNINNELQCVYKQ